MKTNAFQSAYLQALANSTRKHSSSKVVLPVGVVRQHELQQVMRALDVAANDTRQEEE